MIAAVKSHALPVYKKSRIASLLCIFEITVLKIFSLQNKVETKTLLFACIKVRVKVQNFQNPELF